ncbi:MAG TPA: hypothetical protein EYH56_02050 [Nanoarchaeota archaeon]|nr:hypothetical protein [Nanoarchaeota archaeon]
MKKHRKILLLIALSIAFFIPFFTSFSTPLSLEIINPYSYPKLYKNWTVFFKTQGKADLVIKAVNRTEFGKDLEFLEIKCGEQKIKAELKKNSVIAKNYECNEISSFTAKVLTPGKHYLQFLFGGLTAYAENQAEESEKKYNITITILHAGNNFKNEELKYAYFIENNIITALLSELKNLKNIQNSTNSISISVEHPSKVNIIFTKYNKNIFEERVKMFRKGEHEKYGIFTFGYELFKKFIVNAMLQYNTLQLASNTRVILPGVYEILLIKTHVIPFPKIVIYV